MKINNQSSKNPFSGLNVFEKEIIPSTTILRFLCIKSFKKGTVVIEQTDRSYSKAVEMLCEAKGEIFMILSTKKAVTRFLKAEDTTRYAEAIKEA
jgi:hypothetical protein